MERKWSNSPSYLARWEKSEELDGGTIMKFTFECEEMDGLILIDESYLKELNSDLLYSLDILLERYGKSELVYDFPDEEWDCVRRRETSELVDYCNKGKMIVFLMDNAKENCEISICKEIINNEKWLNVQSGKVWVINASELIQCIPYSDMEMDKLLELEIQEGWYAVSVFVNKVVTFLFYMKDYEASASSSSFSLLVILSGFR